MLTHIKRRINLKKPSVKDKYIKVLKNRKPVVLGAGSSGEVFLANDPEGRKVAIKEISKSRIISKGCQLSQIYSEIKIHKGLYHDNIVKLIDFFETDSKISVVLEFIEGENLFQTIRKSKGLPEDQAKPIIRQIASALSYLHSLLICHRDLKLENILITPESSVKLCDFGWAVVEMEMERKTLCGTYEYLAPEVINGGLYSLATDMWAFGVLTFEVIHGSSPFADQNKSIVKNYILNKKLELGENVSPAAKSFLRSSLVSRPSLTGN